MHDSDIFNFLKGFAVNKEELKKDITNDYVLGKITQEQFFKKMDDLK